ncbi:MAG TPA: F0F1 ATP synthase subunit B' [Kiloniellales bacterium]|nr:F0F1 ATP synthase subunit B' [Kiloniellales bacterium]
MPQFDFSTAPSQLFWLVVTFFVLYLLSWRVVLPRIDQVMQARQKKIDDDLARAERLKSEAAAVIADFEKTLAEARSEAARVMKEASDAAAQEAAQRIAAFNAELVGRVDEAEARVAQAVKEAETKLQAIAIEAAGQVTAKLLGSAVPQATIERAVAAAAAGSGGGSSR